MELATPKIGWCLKEKGKLLTLWHSQMIPAQLDPHIFDNCNQNTTWRILISIRQTCFVISWVTCSLPSPELCSPHECCFKSIYILLCDLLSSWNECRGSAFTRVVGPDDRLGVAHAIVRHQGSESEQGMA